ncbi:MAG: endonuclease domain-containing protein [Clostridia bacterium]|nr:endonuclease domain-containing protein [Clostridia bacterium]
MEQEKIKKNKKLLNIAKILRRNMTRQEKHLWYDFLQHYPVKFYKQRIIDDFIVDFYCHQARLVIELDGSQHYTPEGISYDEARTEIIEKYGLRVMRFSNGDIDDSFESVCDMIDRTIKEKLQNEAESL